MAKKIANPWDAIYERIRVHKEWKYVYPRRPTKDDLDKAEQLLGCRLPASYRYFAEQFGLNSEVAGWFRPDSLIGEPDDFFTVVGRTSEWRNHFVENQNDAREVGEDFAAKLVAFGSNVGGGSYAFHTGEITDAAQSEYRVYELGRLGGWKQAFGDTFTEFVDRIARHIEEDDTEEDDTEEDGPEDEIACFPVSAGSLPFQEEAVVGWLAANSGAARQLFAAVRDEGHWEVLPILADALEEAGCDDEHLLYACRSGNVQSDGQWVLDVLKKLGGRK